MQIKMLPVNSLKPDKKQPRQFLDKAKLYELAQNIKLEGNINPIEVDENNVVITGARRLAATKLAGLKEIPCKIVKYEGIDRLKHQLSENEFTETVSQIDLARAYKRLVTAYLTNLPRTENGKPDNGITWLSKEMGKSERYFSELFALLEQPKKFQKAIEKNEIAKSMIRAVVAAPQERKAEIREKILNKEFSTRDEAMAVAKELQINPRASISRVTNELRAERDEEYSALADPERITQAVERFKKLLRECPLERFSKGQQKMIMIDLADLASAVTRYTKGQKEYHVDL